ncbi:nitrate reductase [Acuticoccus sp. I52.16.1]|uniref:nitrate reductase n=1 Tax=Acuticoccus sp. I52.16.1 TaxID=2928472 RepID=UPI001FD151E2|nr:nitrate reductase [Acuticoccus sp. I52.16.1]UOM33247.1 nitrate reductase [Acuticoccus sp. I52.16.1]
MDAAPAAPSAVATTCPYCGVGCGVLATATANGVDIAGDRSHPSNFGRLCSKGSALGETVGPEDRLLHPEIHGARATWDAAVGTIADAFRAAIAEHGPDSVALYVSGQLLTEDYYAANKLMKGFIGTANIDTNSRLCMASSVAGHRRAFGTDTVPGVYEDLEAADLLVLVGSNLAWCHPVLFQRVAAAKAARPEMTIVVVDPRATATTVAADLHLALTPDTDVALFTGLLAHLAEGGRTDHAYVSAHTEGFDDALANAAGWSVARVAEATGLAAADVARFYALVAATDRTVTVYSQGVNQSSCGTDKVGAIINTHLATGRIGRPGTGPFSVTGQPNAMGGREVGGLANMLACHMDIEDPVHRGIVQRFWNAPVIAARPGLKAVDLFEAVHDGRIKALWVMATNPADSMPDAGRVEEALRRVPFLAVSDVVASTDTLRHAHVKLPAAAWGEKDGTVTNSERRISRQRAFLPLPGEARPDWRAIADVAARMGFGDAFAWSGPAAIFDEYARLSGSQNDDTRDFDISGLAGLSRHGYHALAPVQWPVPAGAPMAGRPATRFFAAGRFYTPSRRARFVAPEPRRAAEKPRRYPFTLNTGRVRDHWHTMTRTGRSQRLSSHIGEPFVEIHPDAAAAHGIGPADLVRVTSPRGAIVVRALVTDRVAPEALFVPMHWTDQTSADARVDRLVAPTVDPISGQPALKFSFARVERFAAETYGYAVSTRPIPTAGLAYWASARVAAGTALEFAGDGLDPRPLAERLLDTGDLVGVIDAAAGTARFAAVVDGCLAGAIFMATGPVAVSRAYMTGMLGEAVPSAGAVLAGRPGADQPDPGPIICSCFKVGANQIAAAAVDGARTVAAIGDALQAGTNCGSCRTEIARILTRVGDETDDSERQLASTG